jgi:hypothetical protein
MKWISLYQNKWNIKRFVPTAPRYRMDVSCDERDNARLLC